VEELADPVPVAVEEEVLVAVFPVAVAPLELVEVWAEIYFITIKSALSHSHPPQTEKLGEVKEA